MIVLTLVAAVPVPTSTQPPGTQGVVTILNWVVWVVGGLCLVGALAAGGSLALEHHRGMGGGGATSHLGKVLAACIVVAAAAPIVNTLII